MNLKLKTVLKTAALSAGLLCGTLSMTAQAHPLWVLPAEFNVSGDESTWVTFDASASHTVFGFDKGVSLGDVQIYSPDGDRNRLNSFFKGHRRSVFDLLLDQDGTYKISLQRRPFYFTSYKAGNRDKPKRMMANKMEAAGQLPDNAREVKTMLIDMSSVAFVTRNAPTDDVFKATGKGFELQPVTHPNDIVAGEEVVFQTLVDGKPVAGVEFEITPGGTQYRDERRSLELVSDAQGRVSFTPQLPGPWLLMADHSMPTDSPMADSVEARRFVTFEVIPE